MPNEGGRREKTTATKAELRDEIIRLGPWFLEVELAPDLSTRAFLDAPPGTYPDAPWAKTRFNNPREGFREMMLRAYPDGLEGRSVLDCACNCGGYLFYAKELGAGECYGFDVREHWIDQARFLQRHCEGPTDRMHFEVCDVYDLPDRGLNPFDVVLFNGIFFHLPDPLWALKIAAELSRDLLVVESATRSGLPDGLLAVGSENPARLQSGVYGLQWRPTGPGVLEAVLRWLEFEDVRLVWWNREVDPGWGRMQVLGSRQPGRLDAFTGEVPPPAHLAKEAC
jgi:tRNA (mo5U34)-methyltransferase